MTERRYIPREEVSAIEPEALDRAWLSLFDDADPPANGTEGDISIVTVDGPLESRAEYWFDGYAGADGIVARIRAAMSDANTRAVVLVFSSPGGACAGLLEAMDELRGLKTKPVVAYSEGGCYSAAYTLAMLADRVLVSRASGVGFVGVIATMVSRAEQLAKEGIAVAVLASGSQKTDGHPALPLTDAAKSRMRARVSELADMIADEVALTRGMSRADVLALQAGVFHGQAAVTAGLADEVGTLARAKVLARELAAQTAEVKSMKAVREALGVSADAPETEVAARAGSLREIEVALCGATGEASPAKALAKVSEWKRDAAASVQLRERAEQAEQAERAAYVADVMAGAGLPDSMRALMERSAKADFAAFKSEFPRPSRAQLEARKGDERREKRIDAPPASTGADSVAERAGEPTDEELKQFGLTREEYRLNAPKRVRGGV